MKAIMACDEYGGVGYQGGLPWSSLAGDLSRFKNLTLDKTVVMGRRTWMSLPTKPLPSRTNVVFSTVELDVPSGVSLVKNLEDLEQYNNDDTWFIGGAALLEFVWPLITEFHLTRAKATYDCDAFMNLLYLEQEFNKVSSVDYPDNRYEIWQRK